MRLQDILLAVSIALFASVGTASTVGDANLSKPAPLTYASTVQVDNQALRSRKTARDDEDGMEGDFDNDERASLSLKYLDDIDAKMVQAAKLDDVKGLEAIRNIQADIEPRLRGALQTIKDKGWTPMTMGKELGIGNKLKTMTPAQLREDGNYQLWVHFSQFYKQPHN
ncbi:hypothetical protein PHYBOEH_009171 [Phytophthora boehmeriae]|uniref:RxLR effector protein n=1 Tax=Phytophthora boehmeriae TaxID=109152 RepID=A0A8T1VZT1_9STRA|nr:hypothetical protein PHYBOEH_009171 [Phytophthora boehmeriae]